MDLLKRALAPILPEAWKAIDEEARRVLVLQLSGRKLVDFDGPHGWRYAAVNLGRLNLRQTEPVAGVQAGLRQVQPLVEVRTPIVLDMMDLDAVARGAHQPDLAAVVEAAERIARVEDQAIFYGYEDAGITGILEASPHAAADLPENPASYPHAVVGASEVLRQAGVTGPYALALGPRAYNALAEAADDGYPILKRVEKIVEGPIVWSPVLEGAVLLSRRGGDFVLTVGQDLSIGYAYHEKHSLELYLTESFTFRVLEPAAAVYLKHPS